MGIINSLSRPQILKGKKRWASKFNNSIINAMKDECNVI